MDGTLANSVPALPTRLGDIGTHYAGTYRVCISVDSGVITCYNIPMTIMHMTLAELANSDPQMDSKDSKPASGGRLFDAPIPVWYLFDPPIPVWYATGWISGESIVTVYFSDDSIKHMSHDEACKL